MAAQGGTEARPREGSTSTRPGIEPIGKKELAEMSAFELVLIVTIGDLVQQGVTQEDMSVTGAMLAASTT